MDMQNKRPGQLQQLQDQQRQRYPLGAGRRRRSPVASNALRPLPEPQAQGWPSSPQVRVPSRAEQTHVCAGVRLNKPMVIDVWSRVVLVSSLLGLAGKLLSLAVPVQMPRALKVSTTLGM